MSGSVADAVLELLRDFLAPLTIAAGDDQARRALFSFLGHTSAVSSHPAVLQALQGAGTLSNQVSSLQGSSLDSWDGLAKVLALAKQADSVLEGLRQLENDPHLSAVASTLAEELVALLIASWLRRRHPAVFSVLGLLTLIKTREASPLRAAVVQGDQTLRAAYILDEFAFARISDLSSDPASTLLSWYLPNNMASGSDARTSADRLFPYLRGLAYAVGLPWEIRTTGGITSPPVTPADDDWGLPAAQGTPELDESGDASALDNADEQHPDQPPGDDVITLPPVDVPDTYYASYFPTFSLVPFRNNLTELRIDLKCSSAKHQGGVAGLLFGFSGDFNQTASHGQWQLTFTAGGQIPALLLSNGGFSLLPGGGRLADGSAKVVAEFVPPAGSSGPAFLFGSPAGTRLELGAAEVAAGLTWKGSAVSALTGLAAKSCAIVIAPGDSDSFLASVLPSGGLKAQFDLGLTWSSGSGFAFNGGAGLDATLPLGFSIGGGVAIPSVHIGLIAGTAASSAEISIGLSFSIGPVQAVVDRVGLAASLTYPASGAPGPGDLSLAFKPPSGAGLSIDAAGVSGGGFLSFDTARHQYAGVLQLEFSDIALQAFGLITTQVAGRAGYSLLALVDADFPPVPLGWGFTLNGAGGLLAMHRTANVDALRAALKADQLSTILFPRNAIANAPQILAQLDALFPTAQGRFLFGPVALIGWGTPTLLTAALAFIVELPEPVRIILLARLAVRLPSPSNPLVRVNMDALGVLDLSQDRLSLDATLFDSKLLGFTLSGDMALRATWSAQREFLLAIGGFHPRFTPPAGFPSLQRITIDMPSGIISKLRLAAYLAITSNTVQFGAALDVFIGVSGFGLSGHLGFDALLQIDPFHFDADISGSVALTAGGDDLMSVQLDATLSGPAPWHIAGSFKVHILFFDVHKSFSHTWGEDAPSQPVAAVNVLPLLTTAMADARNWGTQLPSDVPMLVSLRSRDGATLTVHPMAQLEVHESVVPLGLTIERFGAAAVSGPAAFSLSDVRVSGNSVWNRTTPTQDDFAPAQFFDLNDDEKLASPSFERHDAGVRFTPGLPRSGPAAPAKTISYETWYVDQPGGALRPEAAATATPPLTTVDLGLTLPIGASARAEIRQSGKLRFPAPARFGSVVPQAFTIADKEAMASAGIAPAGGVPYTVAKALLAQAAATAPGRRAQLQIVATHEMAAS